ncbi:hypothetical protein CLU79DRAFT_251227 [Phycomyces nitens]|nr:hypothetical protein CLU79DRAFT_251227 [Phycomyces nitens]
MTILLFKPFWTILYPWKPILPLCNVLLLPRWQLTIVLFAQESCLSVLLSFPFHCYSYYTATKWRVGPSFHLGTVRSPLFLSLFVFCSQDILSLHPSYLRCYKIYRSPELYLIIYKILSLTLTIAHILYYVLRLLISFLIPKPLDKFPNMAKDFFQRPLEEADHHRFLLGPIPSLDIVPAGLQSWQFLKLQNQNLHRGLL